MRFFPLLIVLLTAPVCGQPLWVDLGPENDSHGLTVISQGDGENVPAEVAGVPCRRFAQGSRYLYIQADPAAIPEGNHEAYLTVEYLDAQPGFVNLEYDRAVPEVTLPSRYTIADDVIVLGGTGQWARTILRLPDARFGKGQNWQADLRLSSWDLTVRRLELSLERPADYVPGGTPPEAFDTFRAQPGPGMELTFGCVACSTGQARAYRALGATGVETYCTWQTVEDAAEGQWDWSRWDKQTAVLRDAGLKWVPLIIAGPGYTTPRWYREGPLSFPYVCLEHGTPTKIQSLWNPAWRPWVERFVAAFAQRYRDSGSLESVLIGCSGTFGETLYPAAPEDGWPYDIPGPFHCHTGWWAGDDFAIADFRHTLQARYGDIEQLNLAWGTTYPTWEAVRPFIPDTAPSLRARLDMVNWYVQSMTDFAAFMCATVRRNLPDTELYLCVGGAGERILGADFSAQAQAIAGDNVGLRVTNEGSDYAANFAVTREVATACRAFGTPLGIEPAGPVDANGNVARIYNASASGAAALHCYDMNILAGSDAVARFRAAVPMLQQQTPHTYAGLYLSKTSWALRPESQNQELETARVLRDRVDSYLVDRTTLGLPRLSDMRVLALSAVPYAEAEEIAALRAWVEAGGILVAHEGAQSALLQTPEGAEDLRDELLARPPDDLRVMRHIPEGPAPRHFRLEIGKGADADYLFGDWNGQEAGEPFPAIPDATKRWSGAHAGIFVPCDPTQDYTLTLEVHLTGYSLAGPNRVLLNGQLLGAITEAGTQTLRYRVPRALLAGRPGAEVTLDITPFLPTEHGSADARTLGLAVCALDFCAVGAQDEAPVTPRLRAEMDWDAAARCLRRIGQGATLIIPDGTADALAQAVVQALEHPEAFIPGTTGLTLPDPSADRLFATQVEGGVLWYNANPEPHTVDGLTVPARDIAFAPGR